MWLASKKQINIIQRILAVDMVCPPQKCQMLGAIDLAPERRTYPLTRMEVEPNQSVKESSH